MPNSGSKLRVAALAGRQSGRVKWAQLKALGLSNATIADWVTQAYLHWRLPGVYAVGHASGDYEAYLTEALFYASPGAMLSHATAAHWLGLLDDKPRQIHVSTPRQCRSRSEIRVHRRRDHHRIWHDGFPTTTVPQTLLDLAATESLRTVRRALAKADYAGILDAEAVNAILGQGRPGSARLRKALAEHQPGLAHTKSELERVFLELCEQARIPLPEVNQRVAGWEIDALWREERIAVELDGYRNHRSPAQIRRDRKKEMAVRAADHTPVRYSWEQLTTHRREVVADIRRLRAAGA
jgi:predicted transcriptional regulator of viral defense system